MINSWKDRVGEIVILAIVLFGTGAGGVAVVNQVVAVPAAIGAAGGHGVAGSVLVTSSNCSSGPSGSCGYRGDFTSDDGTVRLHDVDLEGGGWSVDASAAALYQGRDLFGPLVFRAHRRRTVVYEVLVLLGGLMMAGLGGGVLVHMTVSAWRGRRSGRAGGRQFGGGSSTG